jgi:DNA-binding CsgD family transcriptional regulator
MARYNTPESRGIESRGIESRGSESPGVELDDEDVENYARHLHLTEREAQVLVLLVTTEDKNDKMANDLGISRRTLQRHIANVYNKAGVQSRIGLYQALATHVAQA